jgi:dienelactone hydrolase
MIAYCKIGALCMFSCFQLAAFAQPAYTNPVYAIRKDSAIFVGAAPNYCGNNFDIKINIYKPIGDMNTKRPVAICVHGGGFTSSDNFNEYHLNVIAQEFAKRGYVGVSIDYREGHHLYNYGISLPYPTSLITTGADWTNVARSYIADSAEAIRSVYRAQQDIKGVVRFMKGNHVADSTCTSNVFLVGHSAGGIAVLTAAFLDQASKKPIEAGASTTVPNPAWKSDGFDWFGTWVVTQINGPQGKDDMGYSLHNPAPLDFTAASCYTRPDLGTINGTILTGNGYDAKVLGVAAMCGAVGDTNIFSGSNLPALYMYHQPNDRVVDYNDAKPFGYLSDGYYPAPNNQWPKLYGSNWIRNKLARIGYPGVYKLWTYDNTVNDPLGLTTHDLLPGDPIVADSIARFFSPIIVSNLCPVVLPINCQLTGQSVGILNRLSIHFNTAPGITDKYSIEKSENGIHFSFLTWLITNNNLEYHIEDTTPNERSFYRIKIKNVDGTIDYSPILQIEGKRNQSLQVYPNPMTNTLLSVVYNNPLKSTRGFLQITNAIGQIIFSKAVKIEKGTNRFQLHVNTIASGTYSLLMLFANERPTIYQKIVKQ